MFDLSPVQLIIVVVIALLVFGPKRLPELARSLGRGVREFRGAVSGEAAASQERSETPEPDSAHTQNIAAASVVAHADPDDLQGLVATDAPPPPASRGADGA